MAGLELLYHSVAQDVSSPQDALVCFVHWELVRAGFKCLGTGDQALTEERKKELLPTGWNVNRELYTLRYRSDNDEKILLLKAITVDSSLIINVMNCQSEQVVDLTVNLNDYVNSDHLREYDRVFKKKEELRHHIESAIVSPLVGTKQRDGGGQQKGKKSIRSGTAAQPHAGTNPLFIPPNAPQRQPSCERRGGMIVDPLRSGLPRSGFDPSSGIPGQLPPGSVPPGARFDPFGPVGPGRSGPDPDHLPPPGYDDLFM
ncbi:proteasome inhibitor PI31 subunit isoform X2 [Hemiscyllium ocellatum]|uniref:proteasome inhibitor PI31 subunit isoform X2 n=1 Tax=Hemiscyllium ocellatum TaxID=170820 RepID=UPI00296661B2|nr:proteasome inhibitor PI31 subunit isoform X2 [Hemiscyllium ocellatum]